MRHAEITSRSIPLKVRTRRVLSGDGRVEVQRSVSCPHAGELPLGECLERECCAGFEDGKLGAYVRCEAPELAASAFAELPFRERDGLAHEPRSRAASTPVSAIMTTDVLCVRPDASVDDLEALLIEQGISGVPVVDASGGPLGVVSKTDLVREHHESGDAIELVQEAVRENGCHVNRVVRRTVSDVMVGLNFALPEQATLLQASALMAYEGVHRLPIVAGDGKVVGILSALDILRWLANEGGYVLGSRP